MSDFMIQTLAYWWTFILVLIVILLAAILATLHGGVRPDTP